MPALTHGRVINGFNMQSRTIKYSKRHCQGNEKICQKDKVCGIPLQPFNRNPISGLLKRVNSKASRDKFSTPIETGRSFASKRAILRRYCFKK